MIYPPGAPGPSPPECPVHQAEGGVAEALHDGVDHMTKPHRPRSHTEVKEDTAYVRENTLGGQSLKFFDKAFLTIEC